MLELQRQSPSLSCGGPQFPNASPKHKTIMKPCVNPKATLSAQNKSTPKPTPDPVRHTHSESSKYVHEKFIQDRSTRLLSAKRPLHTQMKEGFDDRTPVLDKVMLPRMLMPDQVVSPPQRRSRRVRCKASARGCPASDVRVDLRRWLAVVVVFMPSCGSANGGRVGGGLWSGTVPFF